jgi:hypothetical protein
MSIEIIVIDSIDKTKAYLIETIYKIIGLIMI